MIKQFADKNINGFTAKPHPLPLDLHPERDPGNEPEVTIADIRAMSCSQESLQLHELHRHAEEDCCLQQLRHYILAGFPEHSSQLPEVCRPYWNIWNIRNQLTLDDDLLVYGCRILIPAAMRQEVLRHLHESHRQRAHLIVYWPGLDNDIDYIINFVMQALSAEIISLLTPGTPLLSNPRLLPPPPPTHTHTHTHYGLLHYSIYTH